MLKLSLCADQLGLIILPTAQNFVFPRTHRRLCKHILEYYRFCLIATKKEEPDMCWSIGFCRWTIICKSSCTSSFSHHIYSKLIIHEYYLLLIYEVSIYENITLTSEKLITPFELKKLFWLCFEKLSEIHCWKIVFNSDSYMSRECWTKNQHCQKAVEQ